MGCRTLQMTFFEANSIEIASGKRYPGSVHFNPTWWRKETPSRIARIWLALVAVPAVVIALFAFTLAANSTPSTLGGETTPTVAATTPTTSAGTPTTSAGTPTAASTTAATTTAAAAPTTSLPATGTSGDSGGSNTAMYWVVATVVAAIAVGSVLTLTARRR